MGVLRPHQFAARVRFLATEDTRSIKLSRHARERCAERDIVVREVFDALRLGELDGPLEQGEKPGEWKGLMRHRLPGRNEVVVVALLIRDESVLVKTVYWVSEGTGR